MTMIRRVFGVVGLTVGLVAAGVYGSGVASASAGVSGGGDTTLFVATGDIACDTDATAYRNGLGTSAGCRQKAVGGSTGGGSGEP